MPSGTQNAASESPAASDGDAGLAGARAPGDSKGPGDGPDPLFWTRRFSLTTRILAVNLLIVGLVLGGLFVVARASDPAHMFVVMNRLSNTMKIRNRAA